VVEAIVEKRAERRDRTVRYGERARRAHLRQRPDSERSAWSFAKGKAVGCRCRRVQRGLSPKLAGSLCHSGWGEWHPCVVERIAGKRLVKAYARARDPLDVEL
jgi:hypothetical protein